MTKAAVLSKLKGKYDPFRAQVNEPSNVQTQKSGPALEHWTDSAPVIRLSEYLKKHDDIQLITRHGVPVLKFVPPIKRNQTERLNRAGIARYLFIEALDDILYLMNNGALSLQTESISPEKKEHHESNTEHHQSTDDTQQQLNI